MQPSQEQCIELLGQECIQLHITEVLEPGRQKHEPHHHVLLSSACLSETVWCTGAVCCDRRNAGVLQAHALHGYPCASVHVAVQVVHAIGGGLLSLPHMVTVDNQGRVWVVDVGAHTVSMHARTCSMCLTVSITFSSCLPAAHEPRACAPTD